MLWSAAGVRGTLVLYLGPHSWIRHGKRAFRFIDALGIVIITNEGGSSDCGWQHVEFLRRALE